MKAVFFKLFGSVACGILLMPSLSQASDFPFCNHARTIPTITQLDQYQHQVSELPASNSCRYISSFNGYSQTVDQQCKWRVAQAMAGNRNGCADFGMTVRGIPNNPATFQYTYDCYICDWP